MKKPKLFSEESGKITLLICCCIACLVAGFVCGSWWAAEKLVPSIDVNLTLKCMGRVGTEWDFASKTGFWQLTQRFYFIRKGTIWDNWPGIKSQLLLLLPQTRLTQTTLRVKVACEPFTVTVLATRGRK